MESLPYIDTHRTIVRAPTDETWKALLSVARRRLGVEGGVVGRFLGIEPARKAGDWSHVEVGHTLPGFAVTEAIKGRRLVLRGAHRFSRYELAFDLDSIDHATRVSATSSAVFPGLTGKIYRALIIGTRGHRLVVRSLLSQISKRATMH